MYVVQVKAAIDYLEFCVDKLKNNERAIHNFLISFYAKSSDSQKLLNYLNKQSKVGVAQHHVFSCDCHVIFPPECECELRSTVCPEAVYGAEHRGGVCSYLRSHGPL